MGIIMRKGIVYGGSGATAEQAEQIERNKNDITKLFGDVEELKENGGGSGGSGNVNMRYNEETDNIEIYYNGEWKVYNKAYLQSLVLIKDEYVHSGYLGEFTQATGHVEIGSMKFLGFKVNLTNYTKIVASFTTSTGGNSNAWESLAVIDGAYGDSSLTADIIHNNALVEHFLKNQTPNTYANLQLDVSTLSGEHIVAFTCYQKTLSITSLYLT